MDDTDLQDDLISKWDATDMIATDSLSLEDVEAYYKIAQEESGGAYKVLLLDYFGLLRGADDYRSISKIAREVKTMAKRLNTRIILLVQTSREGGDGTVEIKLNHLRDSGALEEAADAVMGLWVSPSDPNRIHASMIKNRYGKRGARFDFINEGLHLRNVEYVPDSPIPSVESGRRSDWFNGG